MSDIESRSCGVHNGSAWLAMCWYACAMADEPEHTYLNGQSVPQPPHAPGAGEPQDAPTPAAAPVPQAQSAFTPYGQAGGVPQAPVAQGTQGHITSTGDEQYSHPGWSWGGFFWGMQFLIAIRKYRHLLLLLAPVLIVFGTVTLWGIVALVGEANGSIGATAGFVLIVPIAIAVSVIFFLALPFYFGFKGRQLAATSKTFANKEQYVGFMKAFDHGAMVAFFVTLAAWVLSLVVGVLWGVFDAVSVSELDAQVFNAFSQFDQTLSNLF